MDLRNIGEAENGRRMKVAEYRFPWRAVILVVLSGWLFNYAFHNTQIPE
jgi:hypothetical protein